MNGIIHPCFHPDDKEAPETEEEMIEDIFKYIDRVFAIIRPRKLLYLAIDGAAPRAKMNQQRSRRFRSARDQVKAQEIEESLRQELEEKGVDLPPKETKDHDSNVITPGTKFMEKVGIGIRYYIHARMNEDPGWKKIKVIFSDASVPGEGEHKISEFIRNQRLQKHYDPNTKHVIHGLDADLIMLALATHEPHFYILREHIVFAGRSIDKSKLEEGASEYEYRTFDLFRVGVLREHLQREFTIENLPFKYDFERIIDDFVFLCFFVGNDFLPHLPSLDIREGAIDKLMDFYKKVLPKIGYITDRGEIDLEKVEVILRQVGAYEDSIFVNRMYKSQQRALAYKRRKEGEQRYREMVVQNPEHVVPLGQRPRMSSDDKMPQRRRERSPPYQPSSQQSSQKPIKEKTEEENKNAAKELKSLLKKKRTASEAISEESPQKKLKTEEGTIPLPTFKRIEQSSVLNKEEEEKKKRIKMQSEEFMKNLKDRIYKNSFVDQEKHPDDVRLGEEGWKIRYYTQKLQLPSTTNTQTEEHKHLYKSYIEGLVWVMKYYYQGVPSWTWYL